MTLIGVVCRSLGATLEMALPTTCGGCGAPGATWCTGCEYEMGHCAYPGGPRQVRPTPRPQGYPPTWAATLYDGVVRAALVAYKDGDRRDLEAVLAPMLSGAMVCALATDPHFREIQAAARGPVLVVPVPSSASAVRRRGDAPLELLTRTALARTARCGSELMLAPVLRLGRPVADQAGLNHTQRATNLAHAMKLRGRSRDAVHGVTCLLVDDVLTTGATLVEAARALRAGGANHVAAATVAATPRRGMPFGAAAHVEQAPSRAATGDPTPGYFDSMYRVARSWSNVQV